MRRIVQTVGNTVPLSFSPTFTGRTKQMYSPLQGRTLTYLETYVMHVSSPKTVTAETLESVRVQYNADAAAQSIDATSDSILLVEGAFQNSYKVRTWVAETQPLAFTQTHQAEIANLSGRNLSIAAATAIAIIQLVIILVAVVVGLIIVTTFCTSFSATVTSLLPGKPSYTGGTPDDPKTFDDWATYLSYQNLLYWYVCPKCGAGFGLKATYPNVADVPATEKQAFDEHKADCLGIPQTNYSFIPLLTFALAGFGLIAFIIWGLPGIIRARKGG